MSGRRTVVVGQAFEDVRTDEQGHGPNSAFFHIDVKRHHLDDSSLFIDRKAFGIPFVIDDDSALDAAYEHHGCAVEVQSVERVLVPFWLCSASTGGYFQSEVLIQNPLSMMQTHIWAEVPSYQFSYPYEDHFPFNQICASHDPSAAMAEELCSGTHVPSLLISRFELVEEFEKMATPPRFLPFGMSTKAAVHVLEQRINRELVHTKAVQELRKYHGNFIRSNIKFLSLVAEVSKMKPVFLPMYNMQVTTASNSKPLPLYVCGATGKARGPVIHRSHNAKFVVNACAGAAALVAGACTMSAVPAAAGAMVASQCASTWQRWLLERRAHREAALDAAAHVRRQTKYAELDATGYKWTVEDEEAMEYSFREELRARARRKADFEQRVKEEAARDEAKATGRKFTAQGRRHRSKIVAGAEDVDPLGYYAVLGLKGKEAVATAKDIAQAFRKEAQKHHPDLVSPDKQDGAKNKMQQLIEAYGVLRDAKLRKEYDEGILSSPTGAPRRSQRETKSEENDQEASQAGSDSGKQEEAKA